MGLVQRSPERRNILHAVEELLEVDRFDDIAIYTQVITAHQVRLLIRSREHDDGNMARRRFGLDSLEHFKPIYSRQFEVQYDDRWIESLAVRMLVLFAYPVKRIYPVSRHHDFILEFTSFECDECEVQVVGVVLDKQNGFKLGHSDSPLKLIFPAGATGSPRYFKLAVNG